jgi:hypothetical protein
MSSFIYDQQYIKRNKLYNVLGMETHTIDNYELREHNLNVQEPS